jgi:hypothetical protein
MSSVFNRSWISDLTLIKHELKISANFVRNEYNVTFCALSPVITLLPRPGHTLHMWGTNNTLKCPNEDITSIYMQHYTEEQDTNEMMQLKLEITLVLKFQKRWLCLYSSIEINQSFGAIYHLHLHGRNVWGSLLLIFCWFVFRPQRWSVCFAANRRGPCSDLHEATNQKEIAILVTSAQRAVMWFECSIDVI